MPSLYILTILNRPALTYALAGLTAIVASAGSIVSAIRPNA